MAIDVPDAPPDEPAPETTRDLMMEAHLRAIGLWWMILGAVIALLFTLLAALMALVSLRGERPRDVEWTELALKVGAIIGASTAVCFLGRYLRRYSNAARLISGALFATGAGGLLLNGARLAVGWISSQGPEERAEVILMGIILHAVPILLALPYLWVLFNPRSARICRPEYAGVVLKTPEPKPAISGSPFFRVPLLVVIVGGIAALWMVVTTLLE